MSRTDGAPRSEDELQLRLDRLRQEPGFRNYLRARAYYFELAGQQTPASSYWEEELANIDYLLDASPLVVQKLRRHCYHITGVWPYSYRTNQLGFRSRIETKLDALRSVGDSELLVPESPILGGFGFDIEGDLYNLDTLRFFECLIAMERAGVLQGLRGEGARSARPIVWEIGPGWGGLAYQLRSLFPDAILVLTDLAPLYLYSATYLSTAFPTAKSVFITDATSHVDWSDVDLVFAPPEVVPKLNPPNLTLTVNTASFQEMTTVQVDFYARQATRMGSRGLYSLNRDRSPYNDELVSVSSVLARHYRTETVSVLDVPYTRLDRISRSTWERARGSASRLAGRRDLSYQHIVGRLGGR